MAFFRGKAAGARNLHVSVVSGLRMSGAMLFLYGVRRALTQGALVLLIGGEDGECWCMKRCNSEEQFYHRCS